MITSLIGSDLMTKMDEAELRDRLVIVGRILDGDEPMPIGRKLSAAIKKFVGLVSDRTTDTPRREARQRAFVDAGSSVSVID